MITPNDLEKAYEDFLKNFKKLVPDGIIQIDLEALSEMGLVNRNDLDEEDPENVTQYFQVVETPDKITLYNEKFAIWIAPQIIDNMPSTLTYIAQVQEDKTSLELVFASTGVYNTPKFILKVLQHFLLEVIDTENIISSIGKKG